MKEILYIAAAGGIGALGRYYMAGLAHRLLGYGFPYGTLAVNLVGSFLIGLLMHVSMNTDLVPKGLRIAATVGFLGAFTTFSTFSYETIGYMRDGSWMLAGANILANLALGIVAVVAGIMVGRAFLGNV